jgi:Protein of unknown function (DUF3179)
VAGSLRLFFYLIVFCVPSSVYAERVVNGFVLENTLVPSNEIRHGGPRKDGIPAIDSPRFITADESAAFLANNDRVLGLTLSDVSKAYPIRILNYHEIVNDTFKERPITISFCPLCGTGMVFDGQYGSEQVTFGVSGLLYNSDLLMYDRLTQSLWSQIEGRAISGPAKGHVLTQLPVEHTSWEDWKQRHPKTLVLSTDTGHNRNYSRSPYPSYEADESIYFPVSNIDKRYHPKEVVLGLSIAGKSRVYPFAELAKGSGTLRDTIAGQALTIYYDSAHRSALVKNNDGDILPSVIGFWFAWMAFHPDSEVYRFASTQQ